jgi:hypothetical protein
MSKHRLLLATSVVLAVLAFPRIGSAGIGELIIEMSGPRMYGILADCRFAIDGSFDSCKAAALKVGRDGKAHALGFGLMKVWLTLGGGAYFSTPGANGFDWGDVWMFAFDPMIEVQSFQRGKWNVYHGVMGLSYDFFVVRGSTKNFTSAALKLRPIGVGYHVGDPKKSKEIDVEYNLRLYPNAFRPEQFGHDPSLTPIIGGEAVHSISVGYRF